MMRLRSAFRCSVTRLFPTLVESLLTGMFLVASAAAAFGAIHFLFIDAAWGGGPEACRVQSGACWPFVAERLGTIVFGFVPVRVVWSLTAAAAVFAVAILAGRTFARLRHVGRWLAVLALCIGALVLSSAGPGSNAQSGQIGGLLLTLGVSCFAVVTGLPLGLLLALMRTSDMPVLRVLATAWIEVWRGIPTVVALFFAIAVFPLLVPKDVDLSKLLRALLAFMLLTSALFAEAIRGGLQIVGKGQKEAAWSLGLQSAQTLRLVILPQALVVAIPNIVNICVALIKETTLVLIIGLYDLFGVIQTAILEPKWAGGSATITGYAVAAASFFTICTVLSNVAWRLETRLKRPVARRTSLSP
jgi:general L-amino acid transport system permease protein